MVDRWTRTPFNGNRLPPGFTLADVEDFVLGRTLATTELSNTARAANIYLVGGPIPKAEDAYVVYAVSDPGYFQTDLSFQMALVSLKNPN